MKFNSLQVQVLPTGNTVLFGINTSFVVLNEEL